MFFLLEIEKIFHDSIALSSTHFEDTNVFRVAEDSKLFSIHKIGKNGYTKTYWY